jgi:parallel beta-helix repeat protein
MGLLSGGRRHFALLGGVVLISFIVAIVFFSSTSTAAIETLGVTLNVKDFGALGNGISDDRKAIQDAINAVPSAGGTVLIPAGTYRIGSSISDPIWGFYVGLKVKSSVNLVGEGIGKSIIKEDIAIDPNRLIINNKSWDSKISISGITIDLNKNPLSSGSGAGLTFVKAKDISIQDLEIKNAEREAVILESVSNFQIAGNVINNVATGIFVTNCDNGKISENTISSTLGDGILVMSDGIGQCKDINIKSNYIKDVGDVGVDIDVNNKATPHENIVVSDNIIENSVSNNVPTGIRVSYSRDIIVANNIVKNLGTGILADSTPPVPRSITIAGNIVSKIVDTGIEAKYAGAIVEGNNLYGTTTGSSTIAIALGGDLVQVSNNNIEGVAYGIKWVAGSVKSNIAGNTIRDVNKYGITDDSIKNFNINSINIVDNVIWDSRSEPKMIRGINFEAGSTGSLHLASNRILGGTSDQGIKLPDKQHQLLFNEIDSQLPSGTFTIWSGVSNGKVITVNNEQVTKFSTIVLTIEGDADKVTLLSINSKSPGTSFSVKVYAKATTTADVKVNYMIFN